MEENKKPIQIELCPICGSVPVIEVESMDYGNGHGYPGNNGYTVYCPCCGIPKSAGSADIGISKLDASRMAVNIWNEQAKTIIGYLLNNTYLRKKIGNTHRIDYSSYKNNKKE